MLQLIENWRHLLNPRLCTEVMLCNGYSCFTDESDRDTQFGDDEEDYDLFSRLEESRAELEGELGCDRFLKVYKTVQVSLVNKDPHLSISILIGFLSMTITTVILLLLLKD